MILYGMMRICMHHDVWTCNILAGENKSRSCWRIKLDAWLPLGMMDEGDKLAGEDNSIGE